MRLRTLPWAFALLGMVAAGACSSDDDGSGADGSDTGGNGSTDPDAGDPNDPNARVAALPPGSNGLVEIPVEQRSDWRADACEGWSAEPELLPSALVFVVDVSGTMNGTTPATGNQTKYEVTRDALTAALDDLPANIHVGLTFYPNMDNGGAIEQSADLSPCIDEGDNVDIAQMGDLGSAHRQALADALAAVDPEPDGATPTHDAFNVALEMLNQLPGSLNRYVVILTDGQPTLLEGCYGRAAPRTPEDTQPIIDAIATANASGVQTFLIGSPGSEENAGTGEDVRDWLSEAARAGSTAISSDCTDAGPDFCHFDMTQAEDFGAALRDGLATIAGSVVVSCSYEMPQESTLGEPIDSDAVNLIYGDGSGTIFAIEQNGAADCEAGWHYASSDASQIEICGVTCDEIMSNPNASIELLFGCETITMIE